MTHASIQIRSVLMQFARLIFAAAALAIVFLLAGLVSSRAADIGAGKALALQWCASCHLVAEDQTTASSTSLPSFYDMAKDPGWTTEKLETFLTDPHPKMPNMSLDNTEIANLSAYIESLNP